MRYFQPILWSLVSMFFPFALGLEVTLGGSWMWGIYFALMSLISFDNAVMAWLKLGDSK